MGLWRHISEEKGKYTALLVFSLIIFFLVVYPFGKLVVRSFFTQEGMGPTLANYWELLTEPELYSSLVNSFKLGFGITFMTLLLGVPMAWGVARTNMPLKGLVRTATVLTFASPSFLAALAWMLLLGPRGGKLNLFLQDLLGLSSTPFNIFSVWGIIFVFSLFSYPLVYFVVSSALDNMDASLEETAQILGASKLRTLFTITLPLVTPAILAGAVLVFIEGLVIFDVPAVLGTPVGFFTLSTRMYAMFDYPPRFEMAAALAVPMIVVLVVMLLFQRLYLGRRQYSVLTGKTGKPQLVDLGPWRWVLAGYCLLIIFASVGVPFLTLIYTSLVKAFGLPLAGGNFAGLDNYIALAGRPTVPRAIMDSALLAVLGTVSALSLAVGGSWVVERTKIKGRELISFLMISAFAFPGVALGVGLVLAYAGKPFYLYGTLWIFLLAYTVRGLPMGFMFSRSALKQISPDLEDAARTLGASWGRTMLDVTVPLLRNSLFGVGVILFVFMFRELGTSVFLNTAGNEVISVVIYELYEEIRFPTMSALSVFVLLINISVVMLARRLIGDNPMRM